MIRSGTLARLLLTALIAGSLVSACNGRADSSMSGGAPQAHRVLVRGSGSGPDSLDPQRAATVEAQNILRDLCESLTSLDRDARPAPGAAASWSASSDGLTYTFLLRPQSRWSNGDRVVAADFVAGLQRLVDPATASAYGQYIEVIKNARAILSGKARVETLGVVAPDDVSLLITLEHPAPYLPALLSHPCTCPVHRPTLRKYGDRFARAGVFVSNGAYTLAEWVNGEHVLAVRNPYYWDMANTHIAAVRWLQVSDASSEYLRYRAGEMDVTATLPVPQIEDIRRTIAAQVHSSVELGTYYYGFNLSRPPFRDNLPLRRALMLAVDREQLAQSVLKIGEPPAYGFVPVGTSGYEPQSRDALGDPRTRVEEARHLFAQSGYSATRPLHFELWYNAGEVHRMVAVSIAQMWHQALGIEVDLRSSDFPTLVQEAENQRIDMFRSSWSGDYNDAESFLQIFTSHSGMNLPRYQSAAYDALLEKAASDVDEPTRRADLQQAERILLHDAPIIPIYYYVSAHLVKPAVMGWHQNVMNVVYTKDLSFAASNAIVK